MKAGYNAEWLDLTNRDGNTPASQIRVEFGTRM
jgi:hypothetical protein